MYNYLMLKLNLNSNKDVNKTKLTGWTLLIHHKFKIRRVSVPAGVTLNFNSSE